MRSLRSSRSRLASKYYSARAMAISDNPRHGSSPSRRRQNPYGLVEQLQRQLRDSLAPQNFSVDPPRHRADFVQLVQLLHPEAGFSSSARVSAAEKRRLMTHRLIQRSEQSAALRHQHHDVSARLQDTRGSTRARAPDDPPFRARSRTLRCRTFRASRAYPAGSSGSSSHTVTLGVRRKRLRSACRYSGSFSPAT